MTKEKGFKSLEQHEREEPQDYERFALTPDQEEAFEQWAKRLVPTMPKEPF